jgi:hypothetical protein
VKYNTFVTFYAWLVASPPFFSFHINFLLISTGQTGEPISMVDGSNDAFPPKEMPFWGLIGQISLFRISNPKTAKKWAWSMVSQPNSQN